MAQNTTSRVNPFLPLKLAFHILLILLFRAASRNNPRRLLCYLCCRR
jgi:hypothetical protein